LVTAVRIRALPTAVNVVLQVLRVIRVLRDHRGSKGIPAVPVLRVTEETRGPWDLRGYLVLPAQEAQEEIQVR